MSEKKNFSHLKNLFGMFFRHFYACRCYEIVERFSLPHRPLFRVPENLFNGMTRENESEKLNLLPSDLAKGGLEFFDRPICPLKLSVSDIFQNH